MLKFLTILPCLIMMFQPLNAKVEKPNYDFSIESFNDFLPERKISDINPKHGKSVEANSVNGMKTLKYQVEQIRYKFPVLVQEQDGVIQDFFAKLPSYFLHDLFLQSLVNRLGKQTQYKRTGEEAFYVWETSGLKHIYSAACTITCFPIFYAVQPTKPKKPSILEQMQKSSR